MGFSGEEPKWCLNQDSMIGSINTCYTHAQQRKCHKFVHTITMRKKRDIWQNTCCRFARKNKMKQNSKCMHQEENAETAHEFQMRHKIKG